MTTTSPSNTTEEAPAPYTSAQTNPLPALYAALAIAQGSFEAIEKNRDVTIRPREGAPYSFRYADLEQILAKTRPALAANGLAIFQTIEGAGNRACMVCRLTHAAGGMVTSEVPMPTVEQLGDPKKFGAAITYLRRYLVTAMLGVAADDDLDEDGEGAGAATEGQQLSNELQQQASVKPTVAAPQRRSQAATPATEAQANGQVASAQAAATVNPADIDCTPCTTGESAYITKKISSKGWSMNQACQAAGLPSIAEGAALTKGYFSAIKAVL